MNWTLPDVWDLPMEYFDFLVDELNREAERRPRG